MKIVCVIQVRNEERFLPGFLRHLAPHVDGIVVLDGGSTDATLAILAAEPKVLSVLRENAPGAPHAHEIENRHRLIVEAARLGADWVMCLDADERLEERFLRRLRADLTVRERQGTHVLFVRIVNLWNSAAHYRVDGIGRPRWTARLFKTPRTITRRGPLLHQPWFPPELDDAPRGYAAANLYHLKMIERRDRQARFDKFAAIDPDHRHQPIGYDHLIDESGLTLRPILPFAGYVDLPASEWSPPPAAPARTDCRSDAAFAARFHLDTREPAAPGDPAPEWPRLRGFDFEALFARVGSRAP